MSRMRNRASALLSAAFLAAASQGRAEEPLPLPYPYENMAQVNGEVILKGQVVKKLGRRIEGLRNAARSAEEFAKDLQAEFDNALIALVSETVVRQEAKKNHLVVSDEEVDVREREIVEERAGGDREKFKELIGQSGLGITEWRGMLRDQVLEETVVRGKLDSTAVFVTPREAFQFYKDHPEDFRHAERVRLTVLKIAWRRGAEERAVRLAEGLRRQVEAGADFKGLSKWSDAEVQRDAPVDLDWRTREDLDPALAGAAFSAEVGTFVGPVKGESGMFLARIEGKEAAKEVPFEEAQQAIMGHLRSLKYRDQYKAATLLLMTEAVIEFKPEHLQRWFEGEKAKALGR